MDSLGTHKAGAVCNTYEPEKANFIRPLIADMALMIYYK